MAWADGKLAGRSLWAGLNDRVSAAYRIQQDGQAPDVELDPYQPLPSTRDFLLSEASLLQSARTGLAIPAGPGDLITYDNGEAQVQHRRPLTPFQK